MPLPARPPASAEARTPPTTSSKDERWVVGFLLVCGLIPWVGYLVLGAWDGRELAIATLVLVFTLRGISGARRTTARPTSASRRARRHKWTSCI